jgi:hypothetical protein
VELHLAPTAAAALLLDEADEAEPLRERRRGTAGAGMLLLDDPASDDCGGDVRAELLLGGSMASAAGGAALERVRRLADGACAGAAAARGVDGALPSPLLRALPLPELDAAPVPASEGAATSVRGEACGVPVPDAAAARAAARRAAPMCSVILRRGGGAADGASSCCCDDELEDGGAMLGCAQPQGWRGMRHGTRRCLLGADGPGEAGEELGASRRSAASAACEMRPEAGGWERCLCQHQRAAPSTRQHERDAAARQRLAPVGRFSPGGPAISEKIVSPPAWSLQAAVGGPA